MFWYHLRYSHKMIQGPLHIWWTMLWYAFLYLWMLFLILIIVIFSMVHWFCWSEYSFFKPNRSLPVVSENLFSHPPLCAIIRNQTGGEGGLEKTVRKEWNRNSWLSDFIGLLHNEFIALRFGTGQYKLLWTAQFSHKAIQIFGRVFPSSSSATFNGTPLSDWS